MESQEWFYAILPLLGILLIHRLDGNSAKNRLFLYLAQPIRSLPDLCRQPPRGKRAEKLLLPVEERSAGRSLEVDRPERDSFFDVFRQSQQNSEQRRSFSLT